MKKISFTLFTLIASLNAVAAEEVPTEMATSSGGPSIGLTSNELLVIAALLFAIVALFATLVLLKALFVVLNERKNPQPYVQYKAPEPLDYLVWKGNKRNKPNVWTKLLSLKPLEEESSLVIPHAYDGINELDNPVPRWFNVLFYATLIFAVSYLYYYHVSDGPLQEQEYVMELEKATEEKKLFLSKSSEKYDENSIKVDGTLIANGKNIFVSNCAACHGEHGQGLVGPNLTDEFWLHGGSMGDIFKTVKYGVPAKGMVSWEKNLSAKNIAEVVNYIHSLQGSKPANAKGPQGEKFEVKLGTDTTANESNTK